MTPKTAATRYARALFDVVLKEKADLEAAEHEIASFVALLAQHPTLEKVLVNPAVPVPRKRAAVVELTSLAKTSPIVTKLFVLLAERDRLILLRDLLASYRDRLLDHRHVVRAEVITATPLAADGGRDIERRLAKVTGRTIQLHMRVDPAIVGGLVAKIGGTVYDASVTRQLQKMKETLQTTRG
jgi:F-type H+-transporting ATPase subunit delta